MVMAQVMWSNFMVQSKMYSHKEHKCQISKHYLKKNKKYKQTKSVTDGLTD